MVEKAKPWVMRTYSGHSSAAKSNELYRTNLSKGQTGLSIAFDLPTQTGYDPDDPAGQRRGRQGRCAGSAPRRRCASCSTRFPLGEMNTSMTINATAAWLLALYIAYAEEQGVDPQGAPGHHAERHRQGVPLARDVHLRARDRADDSSST
jgi:(2R)-ethylmalonyl-CoA mutase